jgi:transcriptional regulator with XRE-family HTH domain
MDFSAERLKKARLEQGISLEEAYKKTKIHLNILKALEGEGLTNLSPVYLKGFLKIYCKFLKVDPKEFLSDYKEAAPVLPKKISDEDAIKQKQNIVPEFLRQAAGRLSAFKGLLRKLKAMLWPLLIIALSGILLFYIGRFIFARPGASSHKKDLSLTAPAKPGLRKEESKQRPKAQSPQPVKAAQKAFVAPKNITPEIRLGVRARENCLLSVRVDGKMLFPQRVLEKGRFESWLAKEKIELFIGDASALELELNGQILPKLGRRGQQLKNVLITKDGLKTVR